MRYLTLFAFISICSLTSCDYESNDIYILDNESDSTLYLTLKDQGIKEFSMTIPSHTSDTVEVSGYLNSLHKKWQHFPSATMVTLKVYTDEAHISQVNFNVHDTNNWTHEVEYARKRRKHWGTNYYTAIIDNNDL